MRDPTRIPRIISLLQQLWEIYPDQRFGQLVENYITDGHGQEHDSECIFHIEDDIWEDYLEKCIIKLKREQNEFRQDKREKLRKNS